jgi:hypothetical protein
MGSRLKQIPNNLVEQSPSATASKLGNKKLPAITTNPTVEMIFLFLISKLLHV